MVDTSAPESAESITLWEEDEWWIIRHEPTGVTTQGRTRIHALLMLADALCGVSGEYESIQAEDVASLSEEVFTRDFELEEIEGVDG